MTAIITGKSRKGYQDMQGNKINDPTILSELKKSNTVISYREVKHGKIHFTINKLDSRFLLKSKKKSGQ